MCGWRWWPPETSDSEELPVALRQTVDVGPIRPPYRDLHQRATVVLLEAVTQHRSVGLAEQARRYLDGVIRTDPEDVLVVGRVVQLAEGQAVGDDGIASRVGVGNDVRGIDQFGLIECANGAPDVVGGLDLAGEDRLVQAPLGLGEV